MSASFFYPAPMGNIILKAMHEVMGREGVEAVLRAGAHPDWSGLYVEEENLPDFSFESLGGLHSALEQAYGPRSGRGWALRIGRASFNYGLQHYGAELEISESEFRLLPLSARLPAGVKTLADLFNRNSDQIVEVEEKEDHILWHIKRCPLCWGRKTEAPACHLAVGLLQESLYWLSGGKIFEVEEIGCIAHGDAACTLRINKQPLSWS